jgi:hypothetical protein
MQEIDSRFVSERGRRRGLSGFYLLIPGKQSYILKAARKATVSLATFAEMYLLNMEMLRHHVL